MELRVMENIRINRTITAKATKNRIRAMIPAILLLAGLMSLNSCEKGSYGDPGLAFVAFTWAEAEPGYIEIENEFIPEVFYWDWYYRVDPGMYYIYYEGTHLSGGRVNAYAWELEYEVWENPGNRGNAFWQQGENGPDAYFTIECSPFGPEVFYEEVHLEKSAVADKPYEVIMNTREQIIIEKHINGYSLRLLYRKVEPRGSGN